MKTVDNNIYHVSLNKRFFNLILSILILIFITSIYITISDIKNYYQQRDYRIDKQAKFLENSLNDIFNYVNNLAQFLSKKIISDYNNYTKIAELLKDVSKNNKADLLAWTSFDYITHDGYVVIDSVSGILDEPVKVNSEKRLWIKQSKEKPGVLIFDVPDIGIISKELILPLGFGIENKNGQFLGYLSAGININKLTKKLIQAIDDRVSFVLLSNDYRVITSSENITQEEFNRHFNNYNLKIDNIIYSKIITFNKYRFILFIGENIDSYNQNFQQFILPQIIRNILMGIIFILILIFLKKEILQPITELSNRVEEINNNNYTLIPKFYKYSEFKNLDNQLLNIQNIQLALYEAQNSLKEVNKTLGLKVKERTRELEKALEVKTEFLNNISHEVRTPIHGVTAITQGIVDHWDELEEERKRDLAKQAAMAANRLFSLVNNILDLSKMTNNKMELHLVNTDLVNLAKEVIEESKELYLHDKKINLVIKEPKEKLPILLIDKQLITQVFRNLITNAIKFTKEGKIEISFEIKSNQIQVQIKDEGIGIPKGEEKEIFGAFTQSTKTKTRAGGTGLGLAICKEIVEMHAGKIWAENNQTGGASLYFVLPIDEAKEENIRSESKINILLIDDERLCIESMKMMLTGSEFEINGAEGGSEGLAYLGVNNSKVDLILLDMMMPDMYGLEVLEKIKNNPQLDHIPVILQTGLKNEDEIQKAYSLGIVNFISKPYKKDEILKVLRTSVRFKYENE